MRGFIRVLGDDPYYKGHKTVMYVAVDSVRRVYPLYGVKSQSGVYWRCTPDHEGAVLISYELTDFSGETYSCASSKELQKLGVVESPPKPEIGFLNLKEDQKLQVDVGKV